jgi:hypothetical protein
MYTGRTLDWQQTPAARWDRLKGFARELLIAAVTAAAVIPTFVYLLLEALQ